ncbi:S41 family peptidase [Zhouia amylolytica]|uniref:S41 family peptidase n=1 Tax=Zhouia amylolytica TaxID=376730 RepID=UPI0020CFA0F0|nr:S41 family peptidase [Zhouia amylolytica]MCQ0112949.1 S41 family peptidase [Zhouia amylolytica]
MKKLLRKRVLIPVLAVFVLISASSFKNDFFEIAKQIEIFTTMFKELNMNYVDETNPAELMDTAIKNMLDDLDPYTQFMNEQDVEEFRIRKNGEYSGIGAVVRNYPDKILIVEPYKDSPADKAGLKAGDEIIKIDDVDVSEYNEDASELLKGANNSQIKLTYKRQGATETATIEREEIEIDAVPFYGKIDDKTGYVVLSRFNRKASKQTQEAIEALKAQGIERLVLDLRGNPGGLLSEAIEVCNLFVPKGELIVSTKSKVKKFNQAYYTKRKPLDENIPLVVLINGRSASASEIVSGALQDLDRAVIIGSQSFGKGLVQRPLKLVYGTQLKVTISRYYTPSGRCIQSLDYWHRDEQGNAVKNTQFNEFKTKNGRKVYDGGGVIPDLKIEALQNNAITRALIQNNVVFDYATNYYYNHPISDMSNFELTESDYSDFKSFVAAAGFEYETKTERELKDLMSSGETKDFGAEVQADYEKLLKDIQQSKISSIDTYKKNIIKELEDELIKRYFYQEGLYNYYLKNDEAIVTSSKLLADSAKFNSILQ